jgi:hypothetical protein
VLSLLGLEMTIILPNHVGTRGAQRLFFSSTKSVAVRDVQKNGAEHCCEKATGDHGCRRLTTLASSGEPHEARAYNRRVESEIPSKKENSLCWKANPRRLHRVRKERVPSLADPRANGSYGVTPISTCTSRAKFSRPPRQWKRALRY